MVCAVCSSKPAHGEGSNFADLRYRLIDLPECLAIASISESTFYRLVRSGHMPVPTKIGRANRWVQADIVAAFQRLAHLGGSR